jgi:hypothetical protein
MERASPWKSDSRSAGQEIALHLWNPKVHYRIQKSTRHYSQPAESSLLLYILFLQDALCFVPINAQVSQQRQFISVQMIYDGHSNSQKRPNIAKHQKQQHKKK